MSKAGWLIVARNRERPAPQRYDISDRFATKGGSYDDPRPIRAWHSEITQRTARTVGGIPISEGTGKYDTTTILIGAVGSGHARRVQPTAASIKTVLRRIREQEAHDIEVAEWDVERAQAALAAAKASLEAAKHQAFVKGNVVRFNEVLDVTMNGSW